MRAKFVLNEDRYDQSESHPMDDLRANFRSWEEEDNTQRDAEELTQILQRRHQDFDLEYLRKLAYEWCGVDIENIDESLKMTPPLKYLDILNEGFGQKDLIRMQDIRTKAAGNHDKEISLATTQAKIIGDAGKAQARAEAAEEVFGSGSDISQIFHDRAVELGGSNVKSKASSEVLAPVVGPVGKGEKIERRFKTQYLLPSERLGASSPEKSQSNSGGGGFSRGNSDAYKSLGIGRFATPPEIGGSKRGDAYVLPLGRVNFGTGECKFFNIYDTWDGTAEIWSQRGKYKVVFTSDKNPSAKIKDYREFKHDQTLHTMGIWTLVDYVPVKEMKELIRVYGGSLPGYTYK